MEMTIIFSCSRNKSDLYIQTQDRLQHNLLLKKLSADSGEWVELHRESSMTWTNLSDDFIELDNQTLAITMKTMISVKFRWSITQSSIVKN